MAGPNRMSSGTGRFVRLRPEDRCRVPGRLLSGRLLSGRLLLARLLPWTCLLILAGWGGMPSSAAALEITLEQEHPTRGEPVVVRIEGMESATPLKLEALYRPQSATEVGEVVGTIGQDGRIEWTPQVAGLASLGVSTLADSALASRDVAVKFDRIPLLGMLIFLGAGILLFGGTTVMLRRALDR